MDSLPGTEFQLVLFLRAFDTGTLPKSAWTHAAHIFTGACMVHTLGPSAAETYMRDAIRRYNLAVGGQNTPTSGYHETITLFWVKLLAAHHRATQPASRLAFATEAAAHFAPQRDLLTRFYDFDVVTSIEARQHWIAPTLQPID
jgi:hypothetical protein